MQDVTGEVTMRVNSVTTPLRPGVVGILITMRVSGASRAGLIKMPALDSRAKDGLWSLMKMSEVQRPRKSCVEDINGGKLRRN